MHKRLGRRQQAEILSYLMGDEMSNGATISTIHAVGIANRNSMLRAGDHFGFYADKKLCGVVGLYNNSQCTIYLTDERVAREVAGFICLYPSRTVFGAKRSMNPVLACLGDSTVYHGATLQHFMVLKSPEKLVEPREGLRFADVSKRGREPAVTVFISQCLQDCFGYDTKVDIVSRVLNERLRNEYYYIVSLGHQPVGQVHIQTITPHYMQIGGVAVLSGARGRGLGRDIVSYVARGILGQGRTPALLVDEDNEIALHIYESLGFERVSQMVVLQH